MKIFVSFVSRYGAKKIFNSKEISAVLSYPNVKFNYFDLDEFSAGTPLEGFVKSRKLHESLFTHSHTSDALRYLILWKFGGTYLDTDMITRKKLDSVPPNFVCDDTSNGVNGAILNMNLNEGRKFAEKFMNSLIQNFNGTVWGSNGPILITELLFKICKTNETSKMVAMKNCDGFHVLPSSQCYPYSGYGWPFLLNETYAEESMKRIVENDSIVVHFWNNLSKQAKLSVNSNCTYVKLAKQYCPKVMASCGEFF